MVDNASGRSFPGLAPGTQVGQQRTAYDAIALGPNLRIAIDTQLVADGAARDAVILWDGTQWHELSGADGSAASDLISGVNEAGQVLFLAGGQPNLGNESGVVALAAALPTELAGTDVNWDNFSGSINNNGRALLRYERGGSGAAGLVFWNGAQLLLVADTELELPAAAADVIFPTARPAQDEIDRAGVVAYVPEMDRPGRSGMLNDRDEMVFRVGTPGADGSTDTSDDYQAIYLARAQ